jgi:outer membrane protein TolC
MPANLSPLLILAALPLGLAAALPLQAAPADSAAESEYTLPDYIREPLALPPDLGVGEPLPLLLRDAVLMAVEGNLGIRLQRLQQTSRAAGLMAARGAFEPRLSLSYDHIDSRSPPSSSLDGAADDLFLTGSDSLQVGLYQLLPTGTQLGLTFSSARTTSSLGTAVEPLLVRESLGFSLRQSLLKGFAFDIRVPGAALLRARMNSKQSALELRVRMAATVRRVEDLYWDLVLALKGWEVQAGSLRLAEEQLQLTGRQIDSGVLPPSDLIQAESTLAQRQLSMVRAKATIGSAVDQLRRVLGPGASEWGQGILPMEIPSFQERDVDLAAALDAAQRQRPELLQTQMALKQSKVDVAVAGNSMLPQLDLDLALGVVGQDSTEAAALEQLGSFEARAWSAGLEFSWTPALRAGLGGLRQAQSSQRSAATRLLQLRADIEVEVRSARRALQTAARQVHAAARFRGLAERSLEVEQRRFLDGISSNFLVAQRQSDLAQSRLAELSALVAHRKARTAWELATGQLLELRGIVVDS